MLIAHFSGMPRRTDLQRILLVGAGPIVIGQACEFDYSGTQGAKSLREEGYQVVLVNSNPATIMTDPELAAATYIEPIEPRTLAAIIEKERPDAVLPTLGGQTGLNLAMKLREEGVLERFSVEMLGARPDSIAKAEDRALFKAAMEKIGLTCPRAGVAHSVDEARAVVKRRPASPRHPPARGFTLGDQAAVSRTPRASSRRRSPGRSRSRRRARSSSRRASSGGRNTKLEVMRDRADNFIDGGLHDREHRPDGRAHGRLDHRGAGDDPDRPRVPAPARRGARRHDRDRRRDRRRERPVPRSTRRTGSSTSSR